MWPSGEVWFSVETGFTGPNSEVYRAGDLLSDQGYVVQRNLELVAPFAPLEDLADFGLDALFIITDASPPVASPRLRPIVRPGAAGEVSLEWDAAGRVSQVFRAPSVSGPWSPISPVLTDRKFIDRGVPAEGSFYRLDHW